MSSLPSPFLDANPARRPLGEPLSPSPTSASPRLQPAPLQPPPVRPRLAFDPRRLQGPAAEPYAQQSATLDRMDATQQRFEVTQANAQQRAAEKQAREAERQRKEQETEQRRQRNIKLEREFRSQGRDFYTDAAGDLQATHSDAEWDLQRQKKQADDLEKARQKTLREQISAVDAELGDPARRILTDTDRRSLSTSLTKATRDAVNVSLLPSLSTTARETDKRGWWDVIDNNPTEAARAATDRLSSLTDRLTRSQNEKVPVDLDDTDLADLEKASPETAKSIRTLREQLAKDEENRSWQEERKARKFDLDLRLRNPQEWERRQMESINAEKDPAALQTRAQAIATDLSTRSAALQEARDRMVQEQSSLEKELTDLQSRNQEAVAAGIPADRLVTLTLPDGTSQPWHAGFASEMEHLQARSRSLLETQAPAWQDLQASAAELERDHRLLSHAEQQSRTRAQDLTAQTREKLKLNPSFAPIASQAEAFEADHLTRRKAIESQFPEPTSPERTAAIEALDQEHNTRIQSLNDQMQAKYTAGAELYAATQSAPSSDSPPSTADSQLSEPERAYWINYFRQADFSKDNTDDKVRVLPDGVLRVNPTLWTDPAAARKAIESSPASQEAKLSAINTLPELEKAGYEALLPRLASLGAFADFAKARGASYLVPGQYNLGTYSEEQLAEEAARSQFKDGASLVKAFLAHEKTPLGWVRNQMRQALMGTVQGTLGLAQQGAATWSAMTGSRPAQQFSSEALKTQRQIAGISQALPSGQFTNQLAGGAVSILPSLMGGYALAPLARFAAAGRFAALSRAGVSTEAAEAAAMRLATRVGLSGAAGAAGVQSFGSTYGEALDSYLAQGLSEDQARSRALAAATASGLTTMAVTFGFGATGVESFLKEGKKFLKATGFSASLPGRIARGAASEAPEEMLDQFLQGLIAQQSYQPDKTFRQIVSEALQAGAVGAVLGGGMQAITGAPSQGAAALAADPTVSPSPSLPVSASSSSPFTPEALSAAQAQIQSFTRPDLAPEVITRTQQAAEALLSVAQGNIENLTDDQLAAIHVVRKADGTLENAKVQGRHPIVKIENGNPIITQPALENLARQMPAVRALIGMDESQARQMFSNPAAGSPQGGATGTGGTPAPSVSPSPPLRVSDSSSSPAPPPQTTAQPSPTPQQYNRPLNPGEIERADLLKTYLTEREVSEEHAQAFAEHHVRENGISDPDYRLQAADMVAEMQKMGGGTRARSTWNNKAFQNLKAWQAANYPEPETTASPSASSPTTSPSPSESSAPSAVPSVSPSPLSESPRLSRKRPDWDAARRTAVTSIQRATPKETRDARARANKAITYLEKLLKFYGPAFRGGIRLDGAPAADDEGIASTGGLMVDIQENGRTGLHINLPLFIQSFGESGNEKAIEAVVTEEVIHVVAMQEFDADQMLELWRALPSGIRQTVYSAYHSGPITDGDRPETIPSDLSETDQFLLSHEFIRMLVQDSVFRGRITESENLDHGVLRQLIDLLRKLGDTLRGMIKKAPPEARQLITDYEATVRQATREMLMQLRAIQQRASAPSENPTPSTESTPSTTPPATPDDDDDLDLSPSPLAPASASSPRPSSQSSPSASPLSPSPRLQDRPPVSLEYFPSSSTLPDDRDTVWNALAEAVASRHDRGREGRMGSAGQVADGDQREDRGPESESDFLRRWARENGKLIRPDSLARFFPVDVQYLGSGNQEHTVVLDRHSGRVLKVTVPGDYGSKGLATWIENARRANARFDDDQHFAGVVEDALGVVQLVLSQPFIAGRTPERPEIDWFLYTKGYRRVADLTYYHPELDEAVSDAQEANFIFDDTDKLAHPIDVHFTRPSTSTAQVWENVINGGIFPVPTNPHADAPPSQGAAALAADGSPTGGATPSAEPPKSSWRQRLGLGSAPRTGGTPATSQKTPKSSTHVLLSPSDAQPVLDYAASIPDTDLYTEEDDYGRETKPHITVLYGLTEHTPEKASNVVRSALPPGQPITVTLGKTSLFENEKYDVLKVDVESPSLRRLNRALRRLPHENDYPDYKPHMTIAYLKKGEGKKYAGDNRFEGRQLSFDSVTFSPPKNQDGNRTTTDMPVASPPSNRSPLTVAPASSRRPSPSASPPHPVSPSSLDRATFNTLDRTLADTLSKAITSSRQSSPGKAVEAFVTNSYQNTAPGQLVKRAVDFAKSQFVPLSLLPREVRALLTEMNIARAFAAEEGLDLVRALSGEAKFSDLAYPPGFAEKPEMKKRLWLAMRGEIPMDSLPQELQDLSHRFREMLRQVGRQAVRAKLISWETYETLQENYLPHYYVDETSDTSPLGILSKMLESLGFDVNAKSDGTVKGLFRKFRLGLNDINAQRSTAWHITDREGKDPKTGGPRLVTWDDRGRKWRFKSREHRDAFYEQFIRDQALEVMSRRPGDLRRVTLDQMDRLETLSPELRGQVREILRSTRQRFQKERPLSMDEQEKAGLIMDPVYALARYMGQMKHDIATAEFFNQIAVNPDWTSDAPAAGYTEIPDHRRFGRLAGKFVQDEIASQVLELVAAPDSALKLYDTVLSWWKTGKTVYNPGSHIRNLLGNMMPAQLSGTSLWNPLNWKHYAAAVKALREGGDDLREMYEQGVLGGDFSAAELRDKLKSILPDPKAVEEDPTLILGIGRSLGRLLRSGDRWLNEKYTQGDEVYKSAAYFKAKAMGMSPKDAAAHVRKWFPYYDHIGTSATIKAARRTVMPFLSFYRESMRIMGHAAVERPIALAGWLSMPVLITHLSAMALGLDDDDLDEIQKDMRGKGKFFLQDTPLFSILLPVKSFSGQYQMWDLSNVIPFADHLGRRMEDNTPSPSWQYLAKALLTGGPILSSIYSLATGKDPFSDRNIWEEDMTAGEKVTSAASHLWNVAAPPIAPGGTGFDTIAAAGERYTNKTLEKRDPTQAVVRALGGLDLRNANPNLYRIAEDWRKANNIPRDPAFDGGTSAVQRARARLFGLLAQDEPDMASIAKVLTYLRDQGQPIQSDKDINRLLFYRNPVMIIKGRDNQQRFLTSLRGIQREQMQAAQREFTRIQSTAPRIISQARALIPARGPGG
jgi:hypothetical protein